MNLFRKKVDRACEHCSYAQLDGEENLICTKKKKQVPLNGKCFRFQYDPLKRVPRKAKALDFSKYEEFDYSL